MKKEILIKNAEKAVSKLIRKYHLYMSTESETEKSKISDEMTFQNPLVWMMYKHKAYMDTDHKILTMGALRRHCSGIEDICYKRFDFLARFIKENYNKDVRDEKEFADDALIDVMYSSKFMMDIIQNKEFMNFWNEKEYYKVSDRVAKWENYTS